MHALKTGLHADKFASLDASEKVYHSFPYTLYKLLDLSTLARFRNT